MSAKTLSVYLAMALSRLEENEEGQAREEFVKMLRGIQKYLSYVRKKKQDHFETVATDGTSRLLKFKSKHNSVCPLLIVPSLINSFRILDIHEDISFIDHMTRVYGDILVIDWGDFAHDPDFQTIEDVKIRLTYFVSEISKAAKQPVDLMGYCMGGSLILEALDDLKTYINKLVFLSMPYDFYAKDDSLSDMVRRVFPAIEQSLKTGSKLSEEWIQTLFAAHDTQALQKKFMRFADLEDGKKSAQFVAIEDWLNDTVALPPEIAQYCMQSWVIENSFFKNKAKISQASLCVAARKDRLVPSQSAAALMRDLAKGELHQPDCGHIATVASSKSQEYLVRPLIKWLRE